MVFKDRSEEFDRTPYPFGPSPDQRVVGIPQAKDRQVGGDHYKNFVIQPGEFCEANRLTHYESNVVKYVCRHRHKGGREDILKAIHYLEMLMEENYGV